MDISGVASMLVTRSEDGMSLIRHDGIATHFSAEAREVYDVSGAGDTVVAAFAAALAVGERTNYCSLIGQYRCQYRGY